MNKVTLKNAPFELQGESIEKGSKLSFKAINLDNQEVRTSDIQQTKIVSFFPDIDTSVCDLQTVKISELAKKHPNMKFISVTVDSPEKAKSWCAKKNINNLDIWSDSKYQEFQAQTNLYIPKIEKLSRGLIVLDKDDVIIDIALNEELGEQPDWSLLDNYL